MQANTAKQLQPIRQQCRELYFVFGRCLDSIVCTHQLYVTK